MSTYSECTKYRQRRELPVRTGLQCVDRTVKRTRAEVEPATHGKVFWGDMQQRMWGTTHRYDFPMRAGGGVDPKVVQDRAHFMRSGSIKLGDAKGYRTRQAMQELPRDHYLARHLFRKGDQHAKTKSELYVCPSGVEEWKTRQLEAMSHRQFTGEAGDDGATSVATRDAVRREMLGSHFQLGDDDREGRWVSRTRADFPGHQPPSGAGAAVKRHPTESSLSLSAPDIRFAARLNDAFRHARPKSAGAVRSDAYSNICKDAAPQLSPHTDETSSRASQHRNHSWRLGYDENASRFVTQQRIFHRPVSYTCTAEQKACYRREQDEARRGSRQRMQTSSVCF